ncbi:winged helix-turn-helix transcriptional regulator [Marinobacter caseinilyticus]|uniref:winged helix-turn-helix transcriptional regulator n=1 Tax=Marinobacter caseinilyticus TaxID=2692195 RepID=UPI001408FFA1|nr:helix-turn-helix domain-containing protein [Marinobacter caseinilyticus]
MKTYGQFCPVAKAAEIFCERWTALILRDLACGASRFSELQRGIPLASPTLLSRRLKQLEAEHIVRREKSESGRSWTYHLTPAGEEFVPIVEALGVWGQHWSRRELAKHEVNLDLLVWAMERSVRPEAFGTRDAIVQVEFTDQPKHKRLWWFRNEHGVSELCLQPPGVDVDLYLSTTLMDMIYIWRGDLSPAQALETGRLTAHGKGWARRVVGQWLGISTLAHVRPRQESAVNAA